MRPNKIAILIPAILTIGCKINSKNVKGNVDQAFNTEMTVLLTEWKNDKYGCAEFRNYSNTNIIVESCLGKSGSMQDVVRILGAPEKSQIMNNDSVYYYYFDGICKDINIIDSSDFCALRVQSDSKNKQQIKIDVICN